MYQQAFEAELKLAFNSAKEVNDVQLAAIEGKGMGVVAKDNIISGQLLISEGPLFALKMSYSSMWDDARESTISEILRLLSENNRNHFHQLHNSLETHEDYLNKSYFGKFMSNSLKMFEALDEYKTPERCNMSGILVHAARINHSCVPNAHFLWDPAARKGNVRALTAITKGEEVTIRYIRLEASPNRSVLLLNRYNIVRCTCPMCTVPADEIEETDRFLHHAREIEYRLADQEVLEATPQKTLNEAKMARDIFARNGGGAVERARVVFKCFEICAIQGDITRAKYFLEMALRHCLLAQGDASPNARCLRLLQADVTQYEGFGKANKWAGSMFNNMNYEQKDIPTWYWRMPPFEDFSRDF
ncbi:hypothetical protein BJ875DRAFT_437286 [Amylocarpus encephaloides]|uniref:SET domain-containing protein n=1 Tax=Amylocarpus encephaloides TaxID=45428 RepID=A0A9P7YS18_9HELO|nr:hypothetical protein BJ875DRAFT_437286 [Amylocarpus encephaloides]